MKTLLMGIAAALLGLLGYASTRPDSFSIERSTTVQAPPEKIYPLLADFRRWNAWSPWDRQDPAMKRHFSGALSGQGAVYAWEGNQHVGSGRMEIRSARPVSSVDIQLDLLAPFEARNIASFTLVPEAGATAVTWTMSGPMPFLSKVMSLFVSMDRMVGPDFETGLANLKAAAEQ
ncbi:MAG: SRPBCC family protein [Sphaerotilus sp.]|nr:SRPBCC family protein [Sphaerotilus sp.]